MIKRYTYTIFVKHSIYWKSFNSLKKAKDEIKRLKKGKVKGIRLNKERSD